MEQGDLYDHDSLVKAIKQVDVVISAVGFLQLADQSKILDAIQEAGNIKVRNQAFICHTQKYETRVFFFVKTK